MHDYRLIVTSAFPFRKKTISSEAIAARKKLNDLYDQNEADVSFSDAILHAAPFEMLEHSTQLELKKISSMLKSDANIIQSSEAIECFLPETQDNCPHIVDNIEKRLHAPDITKLNKLRGAYYVNINEKAPLLFIEKKASGNHEMEIYGMNVEPTGIPTYNLGLIFNPNFRVLAPRGGYSSGNTRFYLDIYGQDDWLHQDASGLSYFGLIPWYTCINGFCSKAYNSIYAVPF